MNILGNTWVPCVPGAACAIHNMQPHLICGSNLWKIYKQLRPHYISTHPLTEISVHLTTTKSTQMFEWRKMATHSWVIVLDRGTWSVQSLIRADGYKPLWLYSLHRQTLNQVEHRRHGRTRKLCVQILVYSLRNSPVQIWLKSAALSIPKPDQYRSFIVRLSMARSIMFPYLM